jgi:DNA invertase Pin-like site-specific DNA recombinase
MPAQPVYPYVRVSGPTQSVKRQRNDLRDDCDIHGFTVVREFTDDGIGASILTTKVRSDYEALVLLIGSGQVDDSVVWLSEVSRLTRTMGGPYGVLRDLAIARRVKFWLHGHQRMVDMAGNSADIEFMNNEAAKAEAEVLTLSRRIRSGVRTSVDEKRPHGRIPYGYRREYDSVTGKLVGQVEHPIHGPIVREIASRYAAGESAIAISRDLNTRGILTPQDADRTEKNPEHVPAHQWHDCDIATRATNPVYTGMRHYSGKQSRLHGIHEGAWPAIIEDAIFVRCVERKRIANSHHYVPKVGRHLVSGIARCGGRCGGEGYIGTREKHGRQCYVCSKGCLLIDEAAVDKAVTEHVAKVLTDDAWRKLVAVETTTVKAAEQRAALADLDYEQFLAKARAGKISLEMAEALEPAKLAAKAEAHNALNMLTTPTVLHVLIDPKLAAFEVYANLDLEIKRKVLAELVTVTLKPIGRGRGREFSPLNIVVE